MGAKETLKLIEGHSFSQVLRWGSKPIVRKPIISITAPNGSALIESTAHGIKDGWPVAITNCKGMTEINADLQILADPENYAYDGQHHSATVIDVDRVELNELNVADYSAHTPNTGFIQYNTPIDLSLHTLRVRLRDRAGGNLVVCTAAGTTGTSKPKGAGADGSVTWAKGSASVDEKVWVAETAFAEGDVVDLSVIASSEAADAPANVLVIDKDIALCTITLTFTAAATTLLSGKTGYYDVEAVSNDATPIVRSLLSRTVRVEKE